MIDVFKLKKIPGKSVPDSVNNRGRKELCEEIVLEEIEGCQ